MVTDKETMHTMMNPKHQKSKHLRQKFEYYPNGIIEQAEMIEPVASRLTKLASEMVVSRNHPPEPRLQRRQGARKRKGKRGH
jgi:hypothetical protein